MPWAGQKEVHRNIALKYHITLKSIQTKNITLWGRQPLTPTSEHPLPHLCGVPSPSVWTELTDLLLKTRIWQKWSGDSLEFDDTKTMTSALGILSLFLVDCLPSWGKPDITLWGSSPMERPTWPGPRPASNCVSELGSRCPPQGEPSNETSAQPAAWQQPHERFEPEVSG